MAREGHREDVKKIEHIAAVTLIGIALIVALALLGVAFVVWLIVT